MSSAFAVLVIEDEVFIRLDICDQLQDLGYKVPEAANADGAIEMLIRNTDIQIMFTDVDLPGGMDGLRLAAAVQDRWPPIKNFLRSLSVSSVPVV